MVLEETGEKCTAKKNKNKSAQQTSAITTPAAAGAFLCRYVRSLCLDSLREVLVRCIFYGDGFTALSWKLFISLLSFKIDAQHLKSGIDLFSKVFPKSLTRNKGSAIILVISPTRQCQQELSWRILDASLETRRTARKRICSFKTVAR